MMKQKQQNDFINTDASLQLNTTCTKLLAILPVRFHLYHTENLLHWSTLQFRTVTANCYCATIASVYLLQPQATSFVERHLCVPM